MFSWLEAEIRAMPGSEYLVMSGLLVAGFGYLVYYSFHAFRRFRFVDGTATSKIRSAAQGLVELKGLAEWLPGDSITSPFSKNRCVWYHCTVDKRNRSGKRTSWSNLSDECSGHLFRLVDETGWCVIDPDHAHVIAESDVTWYGQSRASQSQPPKKTPWLCVNTGNYRFRERLIRPASSLYALGEFHSYQNTPSDEYLEKQAEDRVRQWKLQPGRYLRDFDLDANGVIQQAEWKAIRAAARSQVSAEMKAVDSEHHLLMRPQDRKHPFILSARDEDQLVGSKKFGAYASLLGALLALVSLVVTYSIRPPFPI